MAARDSGASHLGFHHFRHRRHRRPPLSLRLAPESRHHNIPVFGDPGLAGWAGHPPRRLSDELGRRSPRTPAGDPAGDVAGRHLHLAIRLRHQFLGDGRPFRSQHPGGRRHRRHARRVSFRVDLARYPQPGAVGLARPHRSGRRLGQSARFLADPEAVAALFMGERRHSDRHPVAAAAVAAAGIAALARGERPPRSSRARDRSVGTAHPPGRPSGLARTRARPPPGAGRRAGRLARDIHQPAISQPHHRAAGLLAARLCRLDLWDRRFRRGVHASTTVRLRISCS